MNKLIALFVQLKTIKVKIVNSQPGCMGQCYVFFLSQKFMRQTRPKLTCKKVISDAFNTLRCFEDITS